ncbi:(Fe-S)-binding protein [Paenibacillus sp. y28]|uniref:(Fe-S)-binding protein n=1 Tax=Paenibacillus sp. y28 TaxID=3129110 RepID=UPI003018B30D
MRCGFCLPACPTFRETGVEQESPRGRISLMKAAVDGLMEPNHDFEEQMNHCLGCRACEPVCPAGVQYGHLIEQTRDALEDHTQTHRPWIRAVRRIAFQQLFPYQQRMRLLGGALRLAQKWKLNQAARKTGLMKLFPPHLQAMERIMPEASYQGVIGLIGERHPAKGEKIATVGLFRGCIMDVLFAGTNVNTVKLLTEAGFEVVIPPDQNCCGALHAHSGEAEQARGLARRNIQVFQAAGVDYIASNAGGCGASMVEYGHLLHEDPDWKEGAEWFASRVFDISDLLVRFGRALQFSGSAVRITYQDSCHLRNVMRSSDAPRRLMKQVEGAVFTEMKEADRCCGSAGIYNLTQPDMAGQILDHKMAHVQAAAPDCLLTSNPGCLLQMKLGIDKHDAAGTMQAGHVVDFLAERLVPAK